MGIEILSRAHQAGLSWALSEIEARLPQGEGARRWAFVEVMGEAKNSSHLYLPALSLGLRKACSEAQVFWVQCSEKSAPKVVLKLLESSLCEGVFLRGLENFEKAQPASIWGRRWQLASQKSGTELLWLHEKAQPLLGFNDRISWLQGRAEWIRGGQNVKQRTSERSSVAQNYQPAA